MPVLEKYPNPLYLSFVIISIVAAIIIYRKIKRNKKSKD